MSTLSKYFQTSKLNLKKTMSAVMSVFYLDNRETIRELKVDISGKLYCRFSMYVPTYLSVKLYWTLTFRHYFEPLRKKLSSRGSWCKSTAYKAALFLIYSTAEHCARFWCRSVHTRLFDNVFNDALRIVTGYLRLIPTDNLSILAGIQLAGLQGATLLLANRSILDHDPLLHNYLVRPLDVQQKRLKSRRPFVLAARKLLDDTSKLQ